MLLNFYKEFSRYLLERICKARIGVLVIAILLIELHLSAYVSLQDASTHFFLTALFVFTFRIWDDFSDRRHDAKHHPDRLPGAGNPQNTLFYKLLILFLLLFNMLIILLLFNQVKLAVYGALLLLFSTLYLKEEWRSNLRILRNQTVLLKYPIVLYLGSQSPDIHRLFISSVLLYFMISWYDIASIINRSVSSRTWSFIVILHIFELTQKIDDWSII